MQNLAKRKKLFKNMMASSQRTTESNVLSWLYRSLPRIDWIHVVVSTKLNVAKYRQRDKAK